MLQGSSACSLVVISSHTFDQCISLVLFRSDVMKLSVVICCCSRLYQLAKLFLFAPSSGVYSCPLAMTDGAAKTIEVPMSLSVRL